MNLKRNGEKLEYKLKQKIYDFKASHSLEYSCYRDDSLGEREKK